MNSSETENNLGTSPNSLTNPNIIRFLREDLFIITSETNKGKIIIRYKICDPLITFEKLSA